jgi:hypothetical protein
MDYLALRNHLAENGVELTPVEAADINSQIEKIRKMVREQIETDPHYYIELAEMNEEDMKRKIKEYKKLGLKLTMKEFKNMREFLLMVAEQEGM